MANTKQTDRVQSVVDFIKAYYDEPIKLPDIAHHLGLSVSRLCHIFKKQTGFTVIDYLTHIRIERAKKLLSTTNEKICNIYYKAGYNSQVYFCRKFKEVTNTTPLQFRRTNRPGSQLSREQTTAGGKSHPQVVS